MTTPTNTPQYNNNDEFDLFVLAQDLWQQKWLIISITGLVTLLAVAYASLTTPVYQATANVMPPLTADIAPVNLARVQAGMEVLKVEDVYSIFTRNLTSATTRRWFYEEQYRPYLQEQGASEVGEVLTVRVLDAKHHAVQVNLDDPEAAAEFANRFVEEVASRSLKDLEMQTGTQVKNMRKVLESRIEALRAVAVGRRLDRIARLQEALAVAEAAGIESPLATGSRTQVSVVGLGTDGDSVRLATQTSEDSMLFLNGAKAIRAELILLQMRKNEDPFIGELRGLHRTMTMLDLVDSLPESLRLFTLSSAAAVPNSPVKPNKVVIIGLGAVFGGLLAGMIALVWIAIRRRRFEEKPSLLES